MLRSTALLMTACVAIVPGAALANGNVMSKGPSGIRYRIPTINYGCETGTTPRIRVAVQYTKAARARPVRNVRVLLEPAGAKNGAHYGAVTFRPATGLQRDSIATRGCGRRYVLRYEFNVGRSPDSAGAYRRSVRFQIAVADKGRPAAKPAG